MREEGRGKGTRLTESAGEEELDEEHLESTILPSN